MFTEIVLICLSPTIDVTLNVKSLSSKTPNIVKSQRYDAGGKGVNIAKMLKSYGVDCRLVCLCGRDNFDDFKKYLGKDILSDYLLTEGRVRENIAVITEELDTYKIDRVANAISENSKTGLIDICKKYESDKSLVVFSGSLPKDMDIEEFTLFAKKISDNYGYLGADCASMTKQSIKDLKPYVIKPNIYEFEKIMGMRFFDNTQIANAAGELVKLGADNVLVSMGDKGIVYVNKKTALHAEAVKVSVVSEVSAGDATLSGFIFGKSSGLTDKESLRYAAAFGTAAVTTEGVRAVSEKDVEKYFKRINIKNILADF